MSDQKLDLILQEILLIKKEQQAMNNEMDGIKTRLEENTQITKAIHHRQEETDAKLEKLSLDFAKIHGEVVSTKTSMGELAEDQKSIKQLLGEHEISIRSLQRQTVAILNTINDKLNEENYDIAALNKRLFNVESTIEQQDSTINLLARRSLEQENKIPKIK